MTYRINYTADGDEKIATITNAGGPEQAVKSLKRREAGKHVRIKSIYKHKHT